MLQQLFATPRDLEEAGLGRPAIQALPLPQRRRNLVKASGWLAPALRKRNQLPLVVELDPAEFDTSGMTGGASVAWALTGKPSLVQAVAVKFTAGGTVPGPLLAYQVNLFDGAYGSSYSAGGALDATGALVIDGYTFTVSGAVAINDVFNFAEVTDPGVTMATVAFAAWISLHNRGVDAKTEADLQKLVDTAVAPFKKDLAEGAGDLEQSEDATPGLPELGPRGVGQQHPWDFLRGKRGWGTTP